MTALAIASGRLPAVSQPLAEALIVARRNATAEGPPVPLAAPDAVRAEARRVADGLDAMLRPEGAEQIEDWLLSLGMLVRIPKAVDLDEVVREMARLLTDLPAFVFSDESLRAMASKTGWWLTYKELREHLSGLCAPVRIEIRALRAIAAAPPPAPAPQPVDRAQARAAVQALLDDIERRRQATLAADQLADEDRKRRQRANERAHVAYLEAQAAQGDPIAKHRLSLWLQRQAEQRQQQGDAR